MKRFNGSVSFGRTWEEYSSGFGDISNEHWMGKMVYCTVDVPSLNFWIDLILDFV